jgi:hypothetical protein
MKEQLKYSKHSYQSHLSLHSISLVTYCDFISFLLNTENNIGIEGAMRLAEALKSNSTLTKLNLFGNTRGAFDSHSIQIITLVMKELPKYLKHSNQTRLSLHSISAVTDFVIELVLTQYRK